jgi:hypothetical protein
MRDLDDFMITVFCLIDEALPQTTSGKRGCQRGPLPTFWDSEVVTMNSSVSIWAWPTTRRCLPTFGSITPISSPVCARCIARPLCVKPRTCGDSRGDQFLPARYLPRSVCPL